MENHTIIKRNIGKITVSSIMVIAMTIVLLGLVITQFFSFPDYEQEREYNSLKYLAQGQGVTVEEYVEQQNQLKTFYADRQSINEQIINAIHLDRMNELPEALNAIKEFHQQDYKNWPRVYSEAVKANNMDAFKWFIKQKVPCDYSIPNLGQMAFYTAVDNREIDFFEVLIQNGCDIKHEKLQVPVHLMIQRMKDQQWLDLLYSYYPKISLP